MSVAPEAGAGANAALRADYGFRPRPFPGEIQLFSNIQRGEADAWVSAEPQDEGGDRG